MVRSRRRRLVAVALLALAALAWTAARQATGPVSPSLVEAHNRGAVALYRRLARRSEPNLAFSPASIWSALAMAYGVLDATAQAELAAACGFPPDSPQFHRDAGALTASLDHRQRGAEVRLAAALWPDRELALPRPLLRRLARAHRAPIRPLDLHAPDTPARLQAWVRQATRGRIDRPLIGQLQPLDTLVVTSATWLKADWLTPFVPPGGLVGPFERPDGSTVTVSFMRLRAPLGYVRSRDLSIAELPYQGGRLALLLLVPDRGRLTALESELDAARLEQWIDALEPTDLQVLMPAWQDQLELDLIPELRALGVHHAFDPAPGIWLSQARHHAWIRTDEHGTEAAAATALVVAGSVTLEDPNVVTLRCDRPFCYLLRDRLTGAILFAGRVGDPRA